MQTYMNFNLEDKVVS